MYIASIHRSRNDRETVIQQQMRWITRRLLEIQTEHELVTTYDVIQVLHQVPRRLDLVHVLENYMDPIMDIGERPVESLRELRRRADRRRERHYRELHALQQRSSRYRPYVSQGANDRVRNDHGRRNNHDQRDEQRSRSREPRDASRQRDVSPSYVDLTDDTTLPVCLIAEHDSD